jgi:hypothetical protein
MLSSFGGKCCLTILADRVSSRIGAGWVGMGNIQVMRRTFATLSKAAGVDAPTRSAQMGSTVDVNENEYAVL